MRFGRPALALAILVVTASAAAAQSLGDIAKQEEARRKTIRSSGKVYTNENLEPQAAPSTPAPATAPQPVAPAASATSPAATGTPAAPAPAAGTTPASSTPKTEADWRKRVGDERDALARAQTFAEALQTRLNALATDFVNTDDPIRRNGVAADRDKALAELDRVKQEVLQHQKAITDAQDEARRAGIPAGWVR
jgi:hypothetical protein